MSSFVVFANLVLFSTLLQAQTLKVSSEDTLLLAKTKAIQKLIQGQGLVFYSEVSDQAENVLQILVYTKDEFQVLAVFNETNAELMLNERIENAKFISAEQILLKDIKKPVLLTKWTHGAHAEAIRIYNLAEKKDPLILKQTSNLTLPYKVEKGVLVLTVDGPQDAKTGITKPLEIKFTGKKVEK